MTQKCGYCSLRFLVSLRLVPIVSWNLPGGVLNWGEGALVVFQSWSFFWYSVVLETIWISENFGGTWPHTTSQKRKRKNIWEYIIVPNPVIIYLMTSHTTSLKKKICQEYTIVPNLVNTYGWHQWKRYGGMCIKMLTIEQTVCRGDEVIPTTLIPLPAVLLQVFQMSRLSCVARPILPGSAESGTPRQTLTVA